MDASAEMDAATSDSPLEINAADAILDGPDVLGLDAAPPDASLRDVAPPPDAPPTHEVVEIGLGATHSCVRRGTGEVICWGSNGEHELGQAVTGPASPPVAIVGLDDTVALGVGDRHTCAIRRNGDVMCLGSNEFFQLGTDRVPTSATPLRVPLPAPAFAIASGSAHSCAALIDQSIWCWGQTVGSGNATSDNRPNVQLPAPVRWSIPVAGLFAGDDTTCVLSPDGSVHCWGRAMPNPYDGVLFTVPLSAPATDLSVARASCALLNNGSVECWGITGIGSGTLGDGLDWHEPCPGDAWSSCIWAPVHVSGLTDAIGIGGAAGHHCAVRAGGQISCWGANGHRELGAGVGADYSLVPVAVPGVPDTIQIRGSNFISCALTATRSVYCWGQANGVALGVTVDGGPCSASSAPMDRCSAMPVEVPIP